jgi:two-component system, response regulator YesN
VSALVAEGRETLLFYEDLSVGAATYYYPLDLEESVMRAVRSANADLLDSLLGVIRRENLVARHLGPVEMHNLLVELQGTVRRLLNELPDEAAADRAALERGAGQDLGADGLDGISSLFQSLRDWHGRRKRSHNTTLLAAIEHYIAAHFARHDLGLTVISDALGISENYLSSFYKEQTGEGLSAAIHRIRFDEAARLLRSTAETIDAVARRCGYLNTSSFRRAFRQRFGFAPSELKPESGEMRGRGDL